ncbi:hypothetical protein Salat_1703600 [Sesamum alatum]|uniref:Transposase (putative) gypsy type domain-containing protein n=1 Tax=Sesamum alatum TaxID=300844 RepID=A0AAE1Y8M7_9LAMI|nr:hypothetical protein Salat_1703600 [Sesamum alatum]
MSSKSILKIVNLLGLPKGFEILTPIEYQRVNNPPPGCVTVYVAQCVLGLRPFLLDVLVTLGIRPSQLNPNSYRLVIGFLLCCQLYHIEPTVENFLGFHPIPDTYTGPESRYFRLQTMMNRAVVRKFLPENVPSNPLSSSSMRSVLAPPSNIQLSGRGRSSFRTPPVVGPSSVSPSLTPTGHADPSLETPVIEVETSSEGDIIPAPSPPPFVSLSEVGSSSQKRPRVEKAPLEASQVEEAPSSDPTQAAGLFLLPSAKFKFQEEISSLKTRLEEKDRQISVQAMEMESLCTTSLQSLFEGREEGSQAGHSAAVAAYKASPEYAEEVFRQGSSFYADGFTVCAEQFKNLGNLPPDFDFSFLDVRPDGLAGLGVWGLRSSGFFLLFFG